MITQFKAEEFGPLKSVSCKLTPLHAFIGPNDSGKSALLRGLVSAVNSVSQGTPQFWPTREPTERSRLEVRVDEKWVFASENGAHTPPRGDSAALRWVTQGASLARFEVDSLRQPSALVTEEAALNFVDSRGLGLPGVLDLLQNRNDNSFQEISAEIQELFRTVERLRLLTLSSAAKTIAVLLTTGKIVQASEMSEGMLYYIAFAALRRLSGLALLAVEEPETGLHPARIAQVVRTLREISKAGTQVIIATHSPLIVNELQPGEVSVVTRTAAEGTKVRLISQTPDFDKRSKVYALGELWLSYANGEDEAPLLEGKTRDTGEPDAATAGRA